MTKHGIFTKTTNERVFSCYAASETDALDLFAQHRSGYDTFAEMAVSAVFRPACDVQAYPVAQ